MGNRTTRIGLKLGVTLSAGVLAVFLSFDRSRTAAQDQGARSFEMVGVNVPFEKRIGADDGAVFVVHFMGDTHGSLDPCG
jgi:hypothetical protein